MPSLLLPTSQSYFLRAPQSRWLEVWNEAITGIHLSDRWTPEDWQQVISIKEVRALQHFASHLPFGTKKVALIPQADQCTREVANALLKLLEEPPEYLVIILCGETNHLLPTIRSRVQVITLEGIEGTETMTQQVRAFYRALNPLEEETTQTLLYYGPLLHGTLQRDLILEAFSS